MVAEFWPSIEEQLASLNRHAADVLQEHEPAPEGLPPAGSWIRALKVDDDLQATPASPWHLVAGWDSEFGHLMLRCRQRGPGDRLAWALENFLGAPLQNRRRWQRFILAVEADLPAEGGCGACRRLVARDAEAPLIDQLRRRERELIELMPTVRQIATDPHLEDVERGRRLRELFG
jgi:hypothetical protein